MNLARGERDPAHTDRRHGGTLQAPERESLRLGSGRPGHSKRRTLLRVLVVVVVLGLGHAGSRTFPLLTPAFEEWGKDVVMSNVQIRPHLSLDAALRIALPPQAQWLGEEGPGFSPLLEAFAEAHIPHETFWPTRNFEVRVTVGGRPAVLTYHCVIEFFCWRVRDVTCASQVAREDNA